MLVPGERVEARVPAYPDERVHRTGERDPARRSTRSTRTVRARIEVANPAGKLKPGMYATLTLGGRDAGRAPRSEPKR